jgi:hypothetical protein
MFSLPFSDPNFVLSQEKENTLARLMTVRLVRKKKLLQSEKEPAHANSSSADWVRFVETVNVLDSLPASPRN